MSEALKERVDSALRDFIEAATAELRSIDSELKPVADSAAEFVLDGGKRLRPAFCYWGAIAAGAEDSGSLVWAAASLELLQACALIHDDVIDHSETRRGKPAVHRRFAALHRDAKWSGSGDDFGAAAAILLGDVFLAWSEQMLTISGLHDSALRRAQEVSATMRTEVMAGQYLDVVEQARGAATVERALRVARYKSAKYTVERPLHLGAAIAGADREVVAAFTGFGVPIGEAFQLRDDLLGVFGDPAVTGKPAGGDLREGKQTVLVALALESAGQDEAALLRTSLGDAALTDDDVADLRRVIVESGAAGTVEEMITKRVNEALRALEALPLERTGPQRTAFDALVALADAASNRRE